jgi:hypothetical protein
MFAHEDVAVILILALLWIALEINVRGMAVRATQ